MSLISKGLRNYTVLSSLTRDVCSKFLNRRMIATGTANTNAKSPKSTLKLSILGVGLGALVGTGYSIHQLNKPRGHILNEQTTIPMLNEIEIPKITPSKKIRTVGDQSGLKLTLYQYQTCPFCCKVRAFLDYYGISYDVIEVDPVLRQAIKWSPYKKVPILLAKVNEGYQPLNDSSMIISALSSYLQDSDKELHEVVKYYPYITFMGEGGVVKSEIMNRYFLMLDQRENSSRTVDEIKEERQWRKWTDSVLVHMLSPNVYRTREEALQAFSWFSDVGEWEQHFPAWERYLMIYVGAFAMWMIGKRLKKRHNLKDDVRQSLYDECNYFAKAVRLKGTPFMGGNEPNLADLAVYGVLNSIEGCYAFKDLLNNSNIKTWYYSMKDVVQNHRGSAFA
ncbi:hypothetical protein ILUMI_08242 [Ignelater luminosus]|uniref:Glutaredoxin domain-containing protein n=1 Tax=Ignelater luminosus TaxID=2038154 RepID=A0A8K0D4T0_IGNLU|nr:hypothetical protein ILUMI_08242 [Ignelater luminosus]